MPTLSLSYDDIKGKKVANIDPMNREIYLQEADFSKYMDCTKAEWADVKNRRRTVRRRTPVSSKLLITFNDVVCVNENSGIIWRRRRADRVPTDMQTVLSQRRA